MSTKTAQPTIVVADKGFVFVGHVTRHEDGSLTIAHARNVRVYGTTKGLGELRLGPTAKTVLDDCGVVRVPRHAVIFTLACESGW